MHVRLDKLRCPSDSNTEQCMSYRTSYVVVQTLTQNNAWHIGQDTMSFRQQHRTMHVISEKERCPSYTNTEQCMSFRTSYDVLQTITRNNKCHIGKATMSFIHQHNAMHVISDKLHCPSDTNTEQSMSYRKKLRCPSDTSTEQCMSYRTSYDVLHIPTQNSACHIGKAMMSFRY